MKMKYGINDDTPLNVAFGKICSPFVNSNVKCGMFYGPPKPSLPSRASIMVLLKSS